MENQAQVPEMPTQSAIPPQNNQKSKLPLVAGVISALVLLAAGVAFGYWLRSTPQDVQKGNEENSQQALNESGSDATSTPSETGGSSDSSSCVTYTPATRSLSGQISWMQSQSIPALDIFADSTANFDTSYVKERSTFSLVGTVETGSYQGYNLILADITQEGPAFYPVYYRFLRSGDKIVMLGKYSPELNEWDGLDHAKIAVDNNYYLSELEYPETFQRATNRENFERDDYATFKFCPDGLVKLFHHSVFGDVYSSVVEEREGGSGLAKNNGSYGFYLVSPDGTTKVYRLKIDFVGEDNVPNITWIDGVKNTLEYTFTDVGGCGSQNYLSIMSPNQVDPSVDLMEVGTNAFGDKIYMLKDPNHRLLKDIYDNQYFVYEGEKVSFQEFLNNRPVFFWRDPFGRLVKFQNNKFVPMAECGKPVIYLYPEHEQAVSVKLDPAGGFSYTEPEYDQGWNVSADPSGVLVNQADGKAYPYLFWEGRGGLYPASDKGFVVARADVRAFLADKLTALGLNEKESADFMEFWEPRMRDFPYYFVTFYGNSVMDYLAPLTITPTPDTVIRVLMDFRPLSKPVSVEAYEIRTPDRRGFTVVEWGGVLRGR